MEGDNKLEIIMEESDTNRPEAVTRQSYRIRKCLSEIGQMDHIDDTADDTILNEF
jgi:hypothetical protein